ncbi:MAG: hypothetical protein E7013_02995 [Alphaproteobacteria bacterium]|nr:hypothetical protein [Alphaproteobacteria bacterium]
MLSEEDKALWDAYCKTVVPLEKASKFKVFSHKLSKCIPFVRKIKSSVPVVLDLHGFTVQEAYSIFIRFFNHHLEQNTKTIIIITGKGKNDKGILKSEFPKWIDNPEIQKNIIRSTQPVSYGGGAFELTLKKKKEK